MIACRIVANLIIQYAVYIAGVFVFGLGLGVGILPRPPLRSSSTILPPRF